MFLYAPHVLYRVSVSLMSRKDECLYLKCWSVTPCWVQVYKWTGNGGEVVYCLHCIPFFFGAEGNNKLDYFSPGFEWRKDRHCDWRGAMSCLSRCSHPENGHCLCTSHPTNTQIQLSLSVLCPVLSPCVSLRKRVFVSPVCKDSVLTSEE